MSKHEFTTNNDTVQTALFPEVPEEYVENPRNKNLIHHSPAFIPYDNRQNQMILGLEVHVPEDCIVRVVYEMIEAVPDEVFFVFTPKVTAGHPTIPKWRLSFTPIRQKSFALIPEEVVLVTGIASQVVI